MLTLAAINKAISAKGVNAELVHGEGYFYFIGADVELASGTSVMVYRLNQLNLEQWLAELDRVLGKQETRT